MPGPNNGSYIRTFSGLELDVFQLADEHILIEDIAHALALCNRFAGHTKRPISVAQHSVFVSRIVQKLVEEDDFSEMAGRRVCLQALLHDASEAYIGDVTKWLKQTPAFEAYRQLENEIQSKIYRRFACEQFVSPRVDYADRVMVRFEGMKGFGPDFRVWHPNYPALEQKEIDMVGPWGHWQWREAEDIFLTHYRMYAELSA